MERENIKVLLLDCTGHNVSGIRRVLEESIAPSFVFHHYESAHSALRFLRERTVDVILLDFSVCERSYARYLFRQIRDAAGDAPIIIFTGEDEHDLALLVMREGASDRMARESFTARPEGLKSAIELALARRAALEAETTSSIGIVRAKAARELRQMEKKSAADLKLSREESAAVLKSTAEEGARKLEDLRERAVRELRAAERAGAREIEELKARHAAEMKEVNARMLADARYHQRILSWMSGDYSSGSGEEAALRGD